MAAISPVDPSRIHSKPFTPSEHHGSEDIQSASLSGSKPEIDPGIVKALGPFEQGVQSIMAKYPSDKYVKTLHNLIFASASEGEALQKFEKLSPFDQKELFSEYCMTKGNKSGNTIVLDVLRLSALKGWFRLLENLINKMPEFELPMDRAEKADRFGWNLAHFLALSGQDPLPLENHPVIRDMMDRPNKAGATPRDFMFWLSEPAPSAVAAFGLSHGEYDPKKFQELVGCKYWRRPHFTPGSLLRLCFEPLQQTGPAYLSKLMEKKMSEYMENSSHAPNKLQIRQRQDKKAALSGQWECLASTQVAKGEIIGLYSGTVLDANWYSKCIDGGKTVHLGGSAYLSPDIGGGNLTQFINHSFPNCAFFSYHYKGMPFFAVVALEDLQTGSTLFLSYGPNYFSHEGVSAVELNQAGINSFLRQTKNLDVIKYIEISSDGRQGVERNQKKMQSVKLPSLASESLALETWANKVRLEYLKAYRLKWLEIKFKNKSFDWLGKV